MAFIRRTICVLGINLLVDGGSCKGSTLIENKIDWDCLRLVLLCRWHSYRGGQFSRFDCTHNKCFHVEVKKNIYLIPILI